MSNFPGITLANCPYCYKAHISSKTKGSMVMYKCSNARAFAYNFKLKQIQDVVPVSSWKDRVDWEMLKET